MLCKHYFLASTHLVEQLEPRLDDVCGVDEEGGEGPCEAARDEGPVEDGLRGARLLARTQ